MTIKHSFFAIGFTCVAAMIAGCAGAQPDAKAPTPTTTQSADIPNEGSSAPVAGAPDQKPAEKFAPVKTTAVSNTADGSDIIPPNMTGKAPPPEKKAAASKAGGKPATKKAGRVTKPKT